MRKYCPVCKENVKVKRVDHHRWKCQECGHKLNMKRKELEDLATGTFGRHR